MKIVPCKEMRPVAINKVTAVRHRGEIIKLTLPNWSVVEIEVVATGDNFVGFSIEHTNVPMVEQMDEHSAVFGVDYPEEPELELVPCSLISKQSLREFYSKKFPRRDDSDNERDRLG